MELTTRERRIYNRIARVFAPYLQSVPQAILNNSSFDLSALSDELQAALIAELQPFYIADMEAIRLRDGLPDYHQEEMASSAAEWARNSTFALIKDLNATTMRLVQNVVATAQQTPGMTLEDMVKLLEPAFGKQRAQAIAITETTRASAAAINGLQVYYRGYGLVYQRQWITNNDELVCPICGPLNGKYESKWSDRFPDGPPAHPNCRCSLSLRRK